MPALSSEQKAALALYVETYGPDWKQLLLDHWAIGLDVNALPGDYGCYLRQIRNQFGPSWLAQFNG